MRLDRLMWLCAGLFVAFGLPLAFVEDRGWQHVWGGLSYITKATIDGKQQQLYGKACRQPDGSWELVQ